MNRIPPVPNLFVSRKPIPTSTLTPSTVQKAVPATGAISSLRSRSLWLLSAWGLLALTFLLALLLLGARQTQADDHAAGAYAAAIALADAGDPALAQQVYAQLVRQGVGGADLYHNWGATALRAGDVTVAVNALEQAQRLAPRDAGIAAALQTALAARAAMTGTDVTVSAKSVAPTTSLAPGWLARVNAGMFTADERALVVLSLWLAFCALTLAILTPGRGVFARRMRQTAYVCVVPVAFLLIAALVSMLLSPAFRGP